MGRGAILTQIQLIRLASAAPSVKWFLPSEYGTDIAYSPASALEKPHQGKLKVRAYLENKAEVPHLAYTYVVTGPYADMYVYLPGAELRAGGGWDAKEKKSTLVGEKGEGKVSLTTMKEYVIMIIIFYPSQFFCLGFFLALTNAIIQRRNARPSHTSPSC